MTKPKNTHCGEIAEQIKGLFPEVIEYHELRESVLIRIKYTDGKKYTIHLHPEQRRPSINIAGPELPKEWR